MAAPAQRLRELLVEFGRRPYENELQFSTDLLPQLAEIAGYSRNELVFEKYIGKVEHTRYQADATLGRADAPSVVIEIKYERDSLLLVAPGQIRRDLFLGAR